MRIAVVDTEARRVLPTRRNRDWNRYQAERLVDWWRHMLTIRRAVKLPYLPTPFSAPLEDAALPSVEGIAAAVREVCTENSAT